MIFATSTAPYLCAQALDDGTLLQVAAETRRAFMTQLTVAHEGCVLICDWRRRAWLHQMLVACGMEYRHRTGSVCHECRDIGEIPREHRYWAVPERPEGRTPEEWRWLLIDHWCSMVDQGVMPTWTRRGPPQWLSTLLWRERVATAGEGVTTPVSLEAETRPQTFLSRPAGQLRSLPRSERRSGRPSPA